MNHDSHHDALHERWLATGEDAEADQLARTCPVCKERRDALLAVEARVRQAHHVREQVLREAQRTPAPEFEAVVRDALASEAARTRRGPRRFSGMHWLLAVAALVLVAFGLRWAFQTTPSATMLGEHDVALVAPLEGAAWTGTFTWNRAPAPTEEFILTIEVLDEPSGAWRELDTKRVRSTSWTASAKELETWRTRRVRWSLSVLEGQNLVFHSEPVELSR